MHSHAESSLIELIDTATQRRGLIGSGLGPS